jgi:anti-sigma factor RsiW
MKLRHVFTTPDLPAAEAAIRAARDAGVPDEDILLVARSDVEMDGIPDDRKEADTDMLPAAVRGAGYGAGAGLLAGLVAIVIPPLGITFAGAAAATIAGAAVGSWASALMGSSLPDPIRRKFHDEIEAGNILVVIDGTKELLTAVEPRIVSSGARPLPFEASKALS